MSELYHGDYPIDMTPAEARCELQHTLTEQQRLNGRIEAEQERLRQALRNIAEGNLGDAPWQANYARIKEVAAAALATPATSA